MKARLSCGLSSPQMQRMVSSSPSSSTASAFADFLPLVLLALPVGLIGLGGAGEEEALVCTPLFARPERRVESANAC